MSDQDDPRNLPGVFLSVVILASAGLGTSLLLWAISSLSR
jgi:hypothetical protein